MNALPLEGVVVLEFCQYLSGPSAGLRLADFGARVIKIESPKGDGCRQLAIENLWVDDDSLLFHTINRNKESYTANLKDPDEIAKVQKLIKQADVMIHNFRPGVMTKLGLDYEAAKQLNEQIIYAEVTGYGSKGPWVKNPGQDLLLQAKSGLMYTSGNADDPPVPFGLAIGDILCGAQLVQAILGALIRRQKSGKGAMIEISLLEALLDFQFELLTTYYASGQLPERSTINNGHALLGAPYGIYQTQDGFMAIAMVNIERLAQVIDCEPLKSYSQAEVFPKRDEIKQVLAGHLKGATTGHWLKLLQAEDLWAMALLNWYQLAEGDGYQALQMEQPIHATNGKTMYTTRCPVQLNHHKLFNDRPAPDLGEHTQKLIEEFDLA